MAQDDQRLSPTYWRLDADQTKVFLSDGNTLGLAGPGSGKTRVLVCKAVRLSLLHGPSNVAMVTFSKPAVTEIKDRLVLAMGAAFAKQVKVGTFHALCYEMLKNYWQRERVTPPVLLNEPESLDLIKWCVSELGFEGSWSDIQGHITLAKAVPIADGNLRLFHPDPQIDAVINLYEVQRRNRGAIDFSDMVREATFALRCGKAQPLQAQFILSDEYQDIDAAQKEWLDYHAQLGKKLTVVGDDDQSIYAFRAAMGYAAMVQFVDKFSALRYDMGNNYRSTHRVIEAARIVIEKNRDRFAKNFACMSGQTGAVRTSPSSSDLDQIDAILEDYQAQTAINPQASFAVLSRTNLGLDELEMVANGKSILVHRLGDNTILKKEEVVRRIAALNCITKPFHHASLASALMAYGISKAGKVAITGYFNSCDKSRSILDVCFDTSLYEPLKRDDATLVRGFRDILMALGDDYAKLQEQAHSEEAVDSLIKDCFSRMATYVVETPLLAFLRKVLTVWRRGTLVERINSLDEIAKRAATKTGALTLCTAHKSKGMEFDHVWIINCSNGEFPSKGKGESVAETAPSKSVDAEKSPLVGIHSDEERRLFYVAMTRAKQTLTLSYVVAKGPNMYIEELQQAQSDAAAMAAEQLSLPATDAPVLATAVLA
jgi:superfamily I DNA/RNA helicase